MIALRRAVFWLVVPLLLLAGCGNSRTAVPSLSIPAAPGGFHRLGYPSLGLSFGVPRSWSILHQRAGPRAPLVTVVSGAATVACWRYTRFGPVPAGAARLRRASAELIAGQARRVRSTHLFVRGAELVVDEYAPVPEFHSVDHAVFSPLRRSLRLLTAPPV